MHVSGVCCHPGSHSLHMHGGMGTATAYVRSVQSLGRPKKSRPSPVSYKVLHRPAVTKDVCGKRVTSMHCICALKTQTSTESRGMAPSRPGLVVGASHKLRKYGEVLVGGNLSVAPVIVAPSRLCCYEAEERKRHTGV